MAGIDAIGAGPVIRRPGRVRAAGARASASACRCSSTPATSTASSPRVSGCCPARCAGCGRRSCRTWAGTPSPPPAGSVLFAGLPAGTRFYFVHSYARDRDRRPGHHRRARRAVRGRGRARPAVGDPVPPGEVRRRRGARCCATGWARWTGAPDDFTCCPRSTSRTAPRCGWCTARPAPRPATATRARPRWPGSATAPPGCTWSTSTRRSAAAPTRRCWPRWSRRLDVDVELSGGIRDDDVARRGAGHRLPAGSTSAPPRWRTRTWVARVDRRARRPDRGRAGRPRRHAGRPRLDPGRRRPVRDAGPARRRGLRPLRGHRHPPGRRDGRPQRRPATAGCARRPTAPVIASGGVSSLDDLRALAALAPLGVEGAIVGKALYAGAFTLPEALAAASGSGRPPGERGATRAGRLASAPGTRSEERAQ